jgi:hypothetical protein
MAALTFTPASLSIVIHVAGGPSDPVNVRNRGVGSMCRTQTQQLTVGGGYAGFADLAKLGGATWLTVPTPQQSGVAFNVTLDATLLKPGSYAETIRATKGGYTDADLPVSLLVQPEGPPVRAR